MGMEQFDLVTLVIDRGDVESCDTTDVLGALRRFLEPQTIQALRQRIDLTCDGYDSDPRELYEILEVRAFIQKLDIDFPYWLYFLAPEGSALTWLLCCLYPFAQTAEERNAFWPAAVKQYLESRGFPYMNQICALIGMQNGEILELSKLVAKRITMGLQSSPSDDR
jgi:hypothetical protein